MKKFKNKALAVLAILSMAGAGLVACGDEYVDEPKAKTPLEEAAYYIDQIYQSDNGKTKTADFERISKYTDDQNREYTIDWSVTIVTEGAPATSVKVVAGKNKQGNDDANMSLIDIDEESELDVEFKLSGIMHFGEESVNLSTITLKMPKLHIADWAEYVEKCSASGSSKGDSKNTAMSVEGIVTTIIGEANGNTTNAIYVQDVEGKGAYYGYGMDIDPSTVCEVGQKVRLTGETGLYSGTYELLGASVSKVFSDAKATLNAVDYTTKYAAATSLTDASITGAQGLYVEIKDVEITGQVTANGYYQFKKGSLESYVRISSSVCPISKAAQTKMIADHAAKRGWIADVKGIINTYSGAFYLTPIDAEPFNFKSLPVLSDADAVAFEKNNLTFDANITAGGDVALKTAGSSYTDVAIAWDFKAETTHATAAIANNTITFTLGEEAETITLVATISRGSASETKEFSVLVDAESTDQYLPNVITEAKVGTYKMVMECADICTLYATGTLDSKGALETTDKAAKAVDFVVSASATEGKYNIKVGDKYLEGYLNGTYKNLRLVENAADWSWNSEAKVFTCNIDETEYYFGTYLSGSAPKARTMGLSAVSYITGESNLPKIGVSQFVGRICTLKPADFVPETIKEAAVGTYKMVMECADICTLYATGTLDSKGALETTDKAAKAVDFVVSASATEGKYNIKVGDKYLEGYLNGTYKNLRLVDNAADWSWNSEAKVFTCNIDGTEYYFGTYLSGSAPKARTMGLSAVSYITGETNLPKIGVSQFVGRCCTLKLAPIGPTTITAAAAGTYKMVMECADICTLYATGTLDSKGALETTDRISKAVDFVVSASATEGKYNIKVGDKYLEGYLNGTYKNLRLVDNAADWSWNSEAKVFTCNIDGTEYYFGTYLSGSAPKARTMGLSAVSYITGESNLPKIGVSQFVGRCCTIGFISEEAPFEVTHAGTEDDPYTVEEALYLAKSLSKSTYDNTNKVNNYGDLLKGIYVKGVVTTEGTYVAAKGESKAYQSNFSLKDASADANGLIVFAANYNSDIRAYLNDSVVVKGTLMNYNGTLEMSSFVTYKDKEGGGKEVDTTTYAEFASVTHGTSTITLGAHDHATVTGLPASGTNGATISNITVTADANYRIDAVKVNGVAISGTDGVYSFVLGGNSTVTVEAVDANQKPTITKTYTYNKADLVVDGNTATIDKSTTDGYKIIIEKNTSTTAITNFSANDNCRIYQGYKLTIVATGNYLVKEVSFTDTNNKISSASEITSSVNTVTVTYESKVMTAKDSSGVESLDLVFGKAGYCTSFTIKLVEKTA